MILALTLTIILDSRLFADHRSILKRAISMMPVEILVIETRKKKFNFPLLVGSEGIANTEMKLGNDKLTLILTPVWKGKSVLGFASKTCDLNGVALVSLNTKYKRLTALAIAHELGHLLGATHDNSISIMNSNALVVGSESWSENSLEKIKLCTT